MEVRKYVVVVSGDVLAEMARQGLGYEIIGGERDEGDSGKCIFSEYAKR
mgnify:CR=1 FL=1